MARHMRKRRDDAMPCARCAVMRRLHGRVPEFMARARGRKCRMHDGCAYLATVEAVSDDRG